MEGVLAARKRVRGDDVTQLPRGAGEHGDREPELVGGFHTEYSSWKFALFFLGEYCAMAVMACMITTLFFGAWSVPFWPDAPWFVGFAAFLAKAAVFLFLYIWVRWSLPRFRFDQLMGLGWKVFLPVALANVLVAGLFVTLGGA